MYYDKLLEQNAEPLPYALDALDAGIEGVEVPFHQLKDAQVFKIEESMGGYSQITEEISKRLRARSGVSISSFLPFDQLALEFSDGLVWFVWFKTEIPARPYSMSIRLYLKTKAEKYKEHNDPSVRHFFGVFLDENLKISTDMVDVKREGARSELAANYISGINNMRMEPPEFFNKEHKVPYYASVSVGWLSLILLKRFLLFLSCKNVRYITQHPDAKLQKKRKKKGKIPLTSYHLLQLGNVSTRSDLPSNQQLWSNRCHVCMGHARTYTEEKPLFGKVSGTFWIPPHTRGNKDRGTAHKRYVIPKRSL